MPITRRDLMVSSLSAGALSLLPWRFAQGSPLLANLQLEDASPLQRVAPSEISGTVFNGDDSERPHQILWDIDGYIARQGGLPEATESASVVVVGGGVAGLYSVYALRDQAPILIEQDRFFGGNSKGEIVGQSAYSMGAAYIEAPDRDSEIGRLLTELGLWNFARAETAEETTVFMHNRFARGFWQAATDPGSQREFERVYAQLQRMREELETANEELIRQLDNITFNDWLNGTFGRVHPHLLEYFQLYAWSSFAASIDEISAYQMLGFISAETGPLLALPGGNAAITASLHARLTNQLSGGRVRSRSLVVDVRVEGDSVRVTYADANDRLFAIRAKACIFAAPKFVAKKVVKGLSIDQLRAIDFIRYRGYVVANVVLDRAVQSPAYELYCLEDQVPPSPSAFKPSPRAFTDICFGTWAERDQTGNSVLTVYKAFAFDGDRQFLFAPTAHDKHKAAITAAIEPVLNNMGLKRSNILGLRMTRWGHCMPVAARGMIASGIAAAAHQPVGGRVFFANQDNWVNPSFETSLAEASLAVQMVRRL